MPQGVFPVGKLTPMRGGLLSAVTVTEYSEESEQSWAGGMIAWDSISCPSELILADFCSNAARGTIAETSNTPKDVWPFGIVTNYECLTPGLSLEERADIAVQQLVAGTQKALERELWAGQIAQASNHLTVPFLMDNNAVDVTGATADIVAVGVSKLEQGLADFGLGAQGVIHLTRQAALIGLAADVLYWDGDVLTTALGTPVVAGAGYDPSLSPAAPALAPVPAPTPVAAQPDEQWGFATGPVYVHLGVPAYIGEFLDHETNTLSVTAGRTAAVYWDSCEVIAVKMDTTL